MLIHIMLYSFFIWKIQNVGSQSIVSSSEIEEGDTFTVTCDATRAGVPETATTVTQLYITSTEERYFAIYRTFTFPYSFLWMPETTPASNWTFYFNGSLQEQSGTKNNRKTMTIKIVIYDARCSDNYFVCNAVYLDEYAFEVGTRDDQSISIKKTSVYPIDVELYPRYNIGYGYRESVNPTGSIVTLKCEVYGPKVVTITWKFGNSSANVDSFKDYITGTDITLYKTDIPHLSECRGYHHISELSFQINDKYDGNKYVCMAIANNMNTTVGSLIIHTEKSIVNPIVIEEGNKFSVTCNATLAGVPKYARSISSLKIMWIKGGGNPITYAEYSLSPQPNKFSLTPDTRNWTFTFNYGLDRQIIGDSMVIEMMVNDAECSDAGYYACSATYNNYQEEISIKNQSVISLPRAVPVSLNLHPQYTKGGDPHVSFNPAGSNITLTCNATGPQFLFLKWKIRISNKEVNSSGQYIEQKGEPVEDPVQVSFGATCVTYLHSSVLTFIIEEKNDGYVYECVATANNADTVVGNMTIYVTQNTTTADTNDDSNEIVSPSVIEKGKPFTVTCDASRAGVPTTATTVSRLFISWSNGTAPPTIYARYRTYIPPYNTSFPPQTTPPRNWTFTFSGNQQGTSDAPNNTDTMKIVVVVYDADKADEGVYFCNASYMAKDDYEKTVYKSQRVTNETTKVSLNSETNDYSIIYYVLPCAAVVVVVVVVATVYLIKVRRDRARKRRFNLRTLPAIHRESLSPPMDSNGYLSPIDPNGGYAQISDVAIYESSANYYSSINELDFIKESDEQSENTSGMQDKQEGDLDNLSELDTKRDGQLDIKTDTVVDIKTRKRLDIQTDLKPDTKTDKELDKDRQNDSTPADDLNDYTKLYDTLEDVYSPDGNKYLTPNFETFI